VRGGTERRQRNEKQNTQAITARYLTWGGEGEGSDAQTFPGEAPMTISGGRVYRDDGRTDAICVASRPPGRKTSPVHASHSPAFTSTMSALPPAPPQPSTEPAETAAAGSHAPPSAPAHPPAPIAPGSRGSVQRMYANIEALATVPAWLVTTGGSARGSLEGTGDGAARAAAGERTAIRVGEDTVHVLAPRTSGSEAVGSAGAGGICAPSSKESTQETTTRIRSLTDCVRG